MKLTVIDLEMNQPSGKIIEIGAVTIDLRSKEFHVISQYDSRCNPGEYPNEVITNLTGITPESVKDAKPLKQALSEFWSYDPHRNMAAWGDDIDFIIKATQDYKIPFQYPKKMDIKQIVNFVHYKENRGKYGIGLKKSVELEGIEFEGTPHRALWDAMNTAKLIWSVYARL
jgi:inhibitor of KinA sporulation pathway (predicted exonuclease)